MRRRSPCRWCQWRSRRGSRGRKNVGSAVRNVSAIRAKTFRTAEPTVGVWSPPREVELLPVLFVLRVEGVEEEPAALFAQGQVDPAFDLALLEHPRRRRE